MSTKARATHTPGPWHTSGLDPNTIGPVRVLVMDGATVPQQQAVARLIDRGDETSANARLMAAAPELLAAVKSYEAFYKKLGAEFGVQIGGSDEAIGPEWFVEPHRLALTAIANVEGVARA